MAQSIIEVNTSTLKSDVSRIEEELKGIQTDAKELTELLAAMGSMWDGEAKQSFTAAVNDDLGRLGELVNAMRRFAGLTDDARAEYEKCENAVADIVASLRV